MGLTEFDVFLKCDLFGKHKLTFHVADDRIMIFHCECGARREVLRSVYLKILGLNGPLRWSFGRPVIS